MLHLEDAVSSVALQQCFYYNALMAAVYLVFAIINILDKNDLQYDSELNAALVVPMTVFWALAEMCRLYCGFVGNLNERVPETSAFLLITVFPQLPALIYLTFLQEHTYPMDTICGTLMLLVTSLELFIGAAAFQNLIRRQTAQFYRLVVSP